MGMLLNKGAEMANLGKQHLVTYDGKSVYEWCHELGISGTTFYNRIKKHGNPFGSKDIVRMTYTNGYKGGRPRKDLTT